MQISSKEVVFLIGLTSIVFLIAPLFLIVYILSYNRKKRKHLEEKELLQKTFDAELLKTQTEVQEQTLKNIAYNLHDNVGQILSLISITVSSFNLDDKAKLAEKVSVVDDLTKRSIKEIKSLSRLLHGEELISRGLTAAIDFELEWLNRSERYHITFNKNNYNAFNGDSNKEIIVFRLFQEMINNIIQHAKATEIFINLEQADGRFTLAIRDNGIGFNISEIAGRSTGMGLNNIKRRAAILNGTVSIDSAPQQGSLITIVIPYT